MSFRTYALASALALAIATPAAASGVDKVFGKAAVKTLTTEDNKAVKGKGYYADYYGYYGYMNSYYSYYYASLGYNYKNAGYYYSAYQYASTAANQLYNAYYYQYYNQ